MSGNESSEVYVTYDYKGQFPLRFNMWTMYYVIVQEIFEILTKLNRLILELINATSQPEKNSFF
jgi:hypothetical protein